MSELKKLTIFVAVSIILIGIVSLFTPKLLGITPQWGGSDDAAGKLIEEINSGYEPWFTPVWEPPSEEIASLLFSLQSAIGAGIIGYIIGLYKGKE